MTEQERREKNAAGDAAIKAFEKRSADLPIEDVVALWEAMWRAVDFTWEGLADAGWDANAKVSETQRLKRWRAPADFPGDGRIRTEDGAPWKEASLQDYWRWSIGADWTGEAQRLLCDDELREHGLLCDADGELFHAVHSSAVRATWTVEDSGDTSRARARAVLGAMITARLQAAGQWRPEHGGDGRAQFTGMRARGLSECLQAAQMAVGSSPEPLKIAAPLASLSGFDVSGLRFAENTDFTAALFGPKATFQGAVFDRVALFARSVFKGDGDFQEATFGDRARFVGASFGDSASFRGSRFGEKADFSGASFARSARFHRSTFGASASFAGVAFPERSDFHKTHFGAGADFSSTSFEDQANFTSTTFERGASFHSARFGRICRFSKTSFGPHLSFNSASFGPRASFAGCRFEYDASFENSTFADHAGFEAAVFGDRAWFRHATFGDEGSFRGAVFGDRTSFEDVAFGKETRFVSTEFGHPTYFRRATFAPHAFFTGARFHGRCAFDRRRTDGQPRFQGRFRFQDAVFAETADFSETDLPAGRDAWESFEGARFREPARFKDFDLIAFAAFDGAVFEKGVILDDPGRKADRLFREARRAAVNAAAAQTPLPLWRRLIPWPHPARSRAVERYMGALAGGFRTLKLAMAQQQDIRREQRFYRYELKARARQPSTPFWERAAAAFYGLTSDYGASIARPFAAIAFFLLFFAGVFYGLGAALGELSDDPVAAGWQAWEFSWNNVFRPLSALSPEIVDREGLTLASRLLYPENANGWGALTRAVATAESLIALTLAFLFALAVRRRFQLS